MWAFEWHDIGKDLVVRRGQPWFYVRFETNDPTHRVRLVEAELTPEVQRYIDSISGVTSYTNRTFSLFDRARARRPKQLLVKRKA
jgi:heat shock protein HspQ